MPSDSFLPKVLDLYSIKHLSIDGRTTFQQRAKIVQTFCKDSAYRVLILSLVGSNGLNLMVANIIIFLVKKILLRLPNKNKKNTL